MGRVIFIAAVFAIGFITLLAWILSDAQEQIETRDQIAKDGGQSLKRRPRPSTSTSVLKDRPRRSDHVLVEVQLPEGSDEVARRLGGRTLMQLRGNGVAFRRRPENALRWERISMPSRAVTEVLTHATKLPEGSGPGAYSVVLDLGKEKRTGHANRTEIVAILDAATGKSRKWTPPEIFLKTRITDGPTKDLSDWPSDLPAPDGYIGEGATLTAPERIMKALLNGLAERDSFVHSGRKVTVASFEVVIP